MDGSSPVFSQFWQDSSAAAGRVLALAALVQRARLEDAFGAAPDEPARTPPRTAVEELYAWCVREDVDHHLTPAESALFIRSLGTWPVADLIETGWRAETLGTLLWALGIVDRLPPPDRTFPRDFLLDRAGLLRPAHELAARARPRDAATLAEARHAARLWRDAAAAALGLGSGPVDAARDLVAFGKPFGQLTEAELWRVHAIARERAAALDWLAGRGR